MNRDPAVWFPAVRAGTGSDVFTERLVVGLRKRGIRAAITWLPLRGELLPWSVAVPEPPLWATVAHVNTWLPSRFVPRNLPVVASLHHAVHDPALHRHKGRLRSIYHERWIAPNERRVLRRASRIVAVSRFAAGVAKKSLLDVPMQVIYNGIDTDLFHRGNRKRSAHKPFRLLYVGGWTLHKGVDLLGPIMRDLGEGFELRYTGGPAADRDRARMPPNMRDIGRLCESEVVAEMQGADALLFPSRGEGFGLVAAEAMACGLPVIATRGSSLVEVIEDGVAGILCEVDDVVAFANAARYLSRDPIAFGAMSSRAASRAVARFAETAMLDSYCEIYSELSSERG